MDTLPSLYELGKMKLTEKLGIGQDDRGGQVPRRYSRGLTNAPTIVLLGIWSHEIVPAAHSPSRNPHKWCSGKEEVKNA